MTMKPVNVTEFEAHCLRLFDETQKTGEPIELLRRGKPIATVQPRLSHANASYEPGQFKDEIKIVDDFGVEWEALAS